MLQLSWDDLHPRHPLPVGHGTILLWYCESSCSKGDNFRLAVKVRGHPRGWRLAAGPPAIRSAAVAGVIAARQLKTRLQASIPLPQQLPLRGRLSEAQAYQAQKALEQAIHEDRKSTRLNSS